MSHCTCDYHQGQNKNKCFTDIKFEKDGSSSIELNYHIIDENDKCIRCGIFVHGMIEMVTNICPKSLKYSPPKKGQLGEEELEKLFEEFTKESYWGLEGSSESEKRALEIKAEIFEIISQKLKEEREKWRLKNVGLYRQLFAEMNPERTFTAKELWKILDSYCPLFTEEQKKELRDNLNSIMK